MNCVRADAPPESRQWTRQDLLAVAILVLVTAAVYLATVRYGFVAYDDPSYVYENPQVVGGLTAHNIRWAFTSAHVALWLPITWLSLQLDATLFGPEPWGFHLTNTLLHAANAGLVYLLFRRMTGDVGRSIVIALLFALHPLRVESVAWVTERKDVLSLFFTLLAMLAYLRYVASNRWNWMAGATILFACGLMAKPIAITLPCVLLLLDFWPLGRLRSRADAWPRIREKLALFLLSIGFGVLTLVLHQGMAMHTTANLPLDRRFAVAVLGYATYLWQTLVPVGLAIFYPLPREPAPWWQMLLAAGLMLGVTLAAFRLRRTAPYLLVGWLWFVGALVPVSGLFQAGMQAHADRFTYFPHLGLILAVVWGAADLSTRWTLPRWLPATVATVVVAGCAARTFDQVGTWRSNQTVWEQAVAAVPNNYLALCNLAKQHVEDGQLTDALRCHTAACDADPTMFNPRAAQAHLLYRFERYPDAALAAAEAIELAREHPEQRPEPERVGDCWFILAEHSRRTGKPGEAIQQYQESLRHAEVASVRLALGTLLARLGRTDEAIRELSAVRAALPNDPALHFNLGAALSERGRWPEAASVLVVAVRHAPRNATYRGALAAALAVTGRTSEATTEARTAARLDPQWQSRTTRLAWILATHPDAARRRGELAFGWARAACLVTDPPTWESLDAVAAAAAETGRFEDAVTLAERAAHRADQSGQGTQAADIRRRVERYRNRQAYHAPGENR